MRLALRGAPSARRCRSRGRPGSDFGLRREPAMAMCRASPVMSLSGRQLEQNGQAVGVDERMDLGGQSASRSRPMQRAPARSRAADDVSSDPPFCRWRHAGGRGSRNCRSSANRHRRLRDRFEYPIPDADPGPADEHGCRGRRWSVALGNFGPGRTGAQPPVNAVQHLCDRPNAARRAACSAREAR